MSVPTCTMDSSRNSLDEVFYVPLQLAIKALDSAERVRHQASTPASTKQSFERSSTSSGHGVNAAEVKKQMEDDERFGTEVVSLAIRVIATCMFHNAEWGVGSGNKSQLSPSGVPSTASLASYLKSIRLERNSRKGLAITSDELEGGMPRRVSTTSSPTLTRKESSYGRACGSTTIGTSNIRRHLVNSASVSFSSDDGDNCGSEDLSQYAVDDVEAEASSGSTASTINSTAKKRDTYLQPRHHIEKAEAQSPSLHYASASRKSHSTNQNEFVKEIDFLSCPTVEKSLMTGQMCDPADVFSMKKMSGGIQMRPSKPERIKQRCASAPTDGNLRMPDLNGAASRTHTHIVAEDLADILLRICWNLEAILHRRPTYYGDVFNITPLESELKLLKRRAFTCLEYLSTGRVARKRSDDSSVDNARNAPSLEDDHAFGLGLGSGYPFQSTIFPFSGRSEFSDIVGRIFWQEECCGSRAYNTAFVSWKQFVDAFERVFGPQQPFVLERFKSALLEEEETSSSSSSTDTESTNENDTRSYSALTRNTSPPTSSAFSITGLRKMCLSATSSPSRKKRKSHVPKWIRKSMSCNAGDSSESEDICECCLQRKNVNGDSGDAVASKHALGSGRSQTSHTIITVEAFSRFCTNHGGLLAGFVAVTDPGTQIECLGSVEDLSKEELLNLGMLEEGDTETDSGEQTEEKNLLLKPSIVKELLGIRILQLSCGGQHAAVLVEGGEVFTWGKGGFGRLGHGDSKPSPSPKRVSLAHECVQVACGFAYTAVVTSCGQAYAWGAGENGRLGVGDEQDRNKPTRLLLRGKVKVNSICAGSVHTCVLSRDGDVYSFGKHEYTGHGSSSDVLVPRKLDAFDGDKVSQLSVGPGGYHTIALTADSGKVYTWGHNRVGQLGFPVSDKSVANTEGGYFVPKPTWVSNIKNLDVATVVAGWGHSGVVTEQGEVFTCGRNFQGQLGLGEPDFTTVNERGHPYQSQFRKVQGDLSCERVSQFACGGEHSIALTSSGHLFSFGKGHKGQLGLSTCQTRYLPTHMKMYSDDGRQILQVACGNNCTLVLRGRYYVPSLFQLCQSSVQGDGAQQSTVLPPLVDSILNFQPQE